MASGAVLGEEGGREGGSGGREGVSGGEEGGREEGSGGRGGDGGNERGIEEGRRESGRRIIHKPFQHQYTNLWHGYGYD